MLAGGLRPIDPYAHVIEQQVRAHGCHHVGAGGVDRRQVGHTITQLEGTHQVLVTPGRVLGLVAELFQCIGLQVARSLIVRVGKDHMFEYFRSPAIVTLGDRLLGLVHDDLSATHELDVLLPGLDRRQRMQVGRVAVVPAQVALVNRLGVVVDRTVIAAVMPLLAGAVRQLQLLGDFGHGQALVGQVQRLVVDVLEHIALVGNEFDDALLAPHRPMVLSKHNLHLAAIAVDDLVQGLPPVGGVAHLGAAQGIEVVQSVGGVLGSVEQLELWEPDQHFGWRLGARCHLELHLDAVYRAFFAGFGNRVGRWNQGECTKGGGLAEARVHLAFCTAWKHRAVLV
ncbi:hypothetical protein D3C77_329900 [compost metagenome]